MEDSKEGLDEWRDLMMSSKGIFTGFGSENCGSKSIEEIFKEGNFGCNNQEKEVQNSSKFDMEKTMLKGCKNESNTWMDVDDSGVIKNGLSIAERRAIKCGFNASKISTPRFRCSRVVLSPRLFCSPYARLSPGVRPQALLDSLVFLPNSQLYTITGSFVSRPLDGDDPMLISAPLVVASKENDGGSSAMFKPHSKTSSVACFHDADNQVSSAGGLAQSDASNFQPYDSNAKASFQMLHENGHSVRDDLETHNSLDRNQNGSYPHSGTVRTAEDGYNWKKYGQKQVKGSEYPRSYFKCTQTNCQVKKKVERSHDGQITEIIYKGAHNHPKPQPCRKSALGSSSPFNETSDIGDVNGSRMKVNASSVWGNVQPGYDDVRSDWRIEGFERTSPTSTVTEVSAPLSNTQGKLMGVIESAGTPEFSSTPASNLDEGEDAAIQGSFMIAQDSEIEPNLKRRAVRQPRVVVQIESEIDVLDDGYRWRKYGQKVVKGNPNPRSYYKCTSNGCIVRKHVERSSQNIKFVITTYEGKHNHEVPAARNSSYANSGNGSLRAAAATSPQSAPSLPRSSHLPKPEPHSQDLPLYFDTTMECNNDFLRANFLGTPGPGTPSFYPMRYPALPNTTPYSPYGHHPAYVSSIVPTIPDPSFPLPIGFPRSISSYCNSERSHSSVQSLYAGQQLQESDVKLLRPKQERMDELPSQTNSSLIYNHVMGKFRP